MAQCTPENGPMMQPTSLCEDVLGSFTTLGSLPVDVLSRNLDIAGLTVNAA